MCENNILHLLLNAELLQCKHSCILRFEMEPTGEMDDEAIGIYLSDWWLTVCFPAEQRQRIMMAMKLTTRTTVKSASRVVR